MRRLEAVGKSLYTFVDNHDEDRIASKLNHPANLFPVYQLLFTLPGIPSIYYGSEWGIEGKRSRTSDEVLRPALTLSGMDGKAPELISHIAALGKIHAEHDAFHSGSYKELLLTNRQYAFSRSGEHGTLISAVNNDEQPASISIPLPCAASDAVSLLPGEIPFSLENGRLSVTLPANGGAIFKLQEV